MSSDLDNRDHVEDELQEPPKKRRKTTKSKKSISSNKDECKEFENDLNRSNTNNGDKLEAKESCNEIEKAVATPKLKTIQKNAFYYKIGPNFTFHGSTKMEFKVLFASKQLCIRISDLNEKDYCNGIRAATFSGGMTDYGLFGGFGLFPSMEGMQNAVKFMDKQKELETIERIFFKFDDLLYLKLFCQNVEKAKHIVVQIMTKKKPEIKYQKTIPHRGGYTNVSPNQATDLTNGNADKYSYHELTLNQKNEKALNTMITAMKKDATLNGILEKSENVEFDKNKLVENDIENTINNDNKTKSKSKSKTKTKSKPNARSKQKSK